MTSWSAPLPLPGFAVSTGLLQYPASEFDDLTGLFGKRHEHRRWDWPTAGVCPPQQGLHAGQLTVEGVHDRLVFHMQLIAFAGAGQAARQTGLVLGEVLPAQVKRGGWSPGAAAF